MQIFNLISQPTSEIKAFFNTYSQIDRKLNEIDQYLIEQILFAFTHTITW